MKERKWYEVLGISSDAEQEIIRSQYKKLALKWQVIQWKGRIKVLQITHLHIAKT